MADSKVIFETLLDPKGVEDGMNKINSSIRRGAKVAGTAAVAGFTALVGASVKAYADYEQLVGGVDTLFKNSSKKVQDYANIAYRTAGLSANKYMETVTGFSASLLQSLGGDTEKAADYADRTIIDMSDNANKMGSRVEDIQRAYQGFAKQNYGMLDNLKLGYGGTKEEMQRLLEDAEKISGVHYDISSFSDVTEAIHVMQESMGIAGTTAKEAETTIEGSFSSMKGAFENLLVGFAGGGKDMDTLIGNLEGTVKTFVGNLVPVIQTTLDSIGNVFPVLKPITSTINFLISNVKTLLAILVPLTAAFIAWRAALVVSTLISKITAATEGLTAAQVLAKIAQNALNASMLANPIVLIVAAITALVAAFIYLWNTSDSFRQFWIDLWNGIVGFVTGVVNAIATFFTETLPNAIKTFITRAVEFLIWWETLPIRIALYLAQIIANVIRWAADLVSRGVSAARDFVSSIINSVASLPHKFVEIGSNVIKGFWNGIKNAKDWLVSKISGFFGGIKDSIKDFFGIHSPSVWAKKTIGFNIVYGLGNGIVDQTKYAISAAKKMVGAVKDSMTTDIDGLSLGINGSIQSQYYGGFNNTGLAPTKIEVRQDVQINQPVRSHSEMARALREEALKLGLAGV